MILKRAIVRLVSLLLSVSALTACDVGGLSEHGTRSGTPASQNSERLASTRNITEAPAAGPSTPNGTGGINSPETLSKPYLILISFDGFRYDYLDRFETPNFDRVAAAGVRAEALIPVFPSLTFPSHYSIATGLYPERHGIVGNRFFDPARGEEYDSRDSADAQDGTWYRGQPLWVTAETQGMVSAAYFFVGTEAEISGIRPTFWFQYDGAVPNVQRIDQTLAWLRLPDRRRPHLITLYFSAVDAAGHRVGPTGQAVADAVEVMDGTLGWLLDRLAALPFRDRIYVVIVSDHGMDSVDPAKYEVLTEVADLRGVRTVVTGVGASFFVRNAARAARLRDQLNDRLRHARAYLRQDVPPTLHYRADPRIGDVVVIPTEGAMVDIERREDLPRGMHGWDPALPAMHGIFLAMGPGIAPGQILPAFESIHLYPWLATRLGLSPTTAIDGDAKVLSDLLAPVEVR